MWPGENVEQEGQPFLYTPVQKSDNSHSSVQHGTLMLSKVFGGSAGLHTGENGVSRRAAVTIVQLPKAIRGLTAENVLPAFRFRTITAALEAVLQNIQTRNIAHRAVINLSVGIDEEIVGPSALRIPVPGDPPYPMYQTLQDLIDAGVVVLAASGNDGDAAKISHFSKSHLQSLTDT